MSISPIITFKAGKCDANFDVSPPRVTPDPTPGYIYLYSEDDLLHFCWRPRDASLANPDLDLMMVPTDGIFKPYLGEAKVANTSPVNGRVFVLKFQSSAQRHWFWLQSLENPVGSAKTFSPRDLRLGQMVNSLLQGEETDTSAAFTGLEPRQYDEGDDDDTMMEDVQEEHHRSASTGGAGADATGGDVRDEGEDSREGGADGGRAAETTDARSHANTAIQNFINSLKGGASMGASTGQSDTLFTTLGDLLTPATTVPAIESADPSFIEELLVRHLPPSLVFLEHQVDDPDAEADEDVLRASVQALSLGQQKDIVKRVLRSPQFSQGLATVTSALRDGGLPTVSEALGVRVKNGGYSALNSAAPVTGGDAVEAFLDGVKDSAKKPGSEGSAP